VARRGLDETAVVADAAALADEAGLPAVTLAAVAARLGVRPPSLYNHVADRAGLLRGVALLTYRDMGDALREAAVGRAGPDALRAAGRAYRGYVVAHPGRYATTTRAPDPADTEVFATAGRALDVLLASLRAWPLAGDEQIHAARLVRSALHGFASIEAEGGFGIDVDVDASFERLLTGLVVALDGWPAAA
jgi:AcrR family transcriptional regulator